MLALPSWGTVTTVDAPAALVAAHAAYHLACGAAEVHVFVDSADRKTRALLSGIPRVIVTGTNGYYWSRVHGRRPPELHQVRQTLNATRARQTSDVDFLLHLDADEFLWQRSPIVEELAEMPDGAFLHLGVAERFFAPSDPGDRIFTRTFRLPEDLFDPEDLSLTRDAEGLTLRGLTGHVAGKSATPKGHDYIVGIHHPRRAGADWSLPRRVRSVDSSILHFDGFTALDWVHKLLRKAEQIGAHSGAPVSEVRLRQVETVLAAGQDMAAIMAVHDRLKRLDAAAEARLRAADRLVDVDPEIEAALREVFAGSVHLPTAQVYDRWLATIKGEVFRSFGLTPLAQVS